MVLTVGRFGDQIQALILLQSSLPRVGKWRLWAVGVAMERDAEGGEQRERENFKLSLVVTSHSF